MKGSSLCKCLLWHRLFTKGTSGSWGNPVTFCLGEIQLIRCHHLYYVNKKPNYNKKDSNYCLWPTYWSTLKAVLVVACPTNWTIDSSYTYTSIAWQVIVLRRDSIIKVKLTLNCSSMRLKSLNNSGYFNLRSEVQTGNRLSRLSDRSLMCPSSTGGVRQRLGLFVHHIMILWGWLSTLFLFFVLLIFPQAFHPIIALLGPSPSLALFSPLAPLLVPSLLFSLPTSLSLSLSDSDKLPIGLGNPSCHIPHLNTHFHSSLALLFSSFFSPIQPFFPPLSFQSKVSEAHQGVSEGKDLPDNSCFHMCAHLLGNIWTECAQKHDV